MKAKLILFVILFSFYTIQLFPQNKTVTIDQRLSNDVQVGTLKKWNWPNWSSSFSPGSQFSFPIGYPQVILGDQSVYSNQKYNNWNSNFSNVKNQHSFEISPQTDLLLSNFLPTATGITIKTSLEGTNTTGGVVKFSDPWFIDYQDGQYGNQLRNRGMNEAFPWERSSPFYPNASTYYEYGQKYNGIFLDQPMVSGRSYYKVSVPEEQTISVHGQNRKFYPYKWEGSGVNYEDAKSMETGVVFNASNAVAKAVLKGELLSNTEDAITNNSQRKTIKTAEGDYLLLYESMDGVWLHSKPLNSPSVEFLIDINSKNPSIDYLGNSIAIVYEKTESNQLKLCYKLLSSLTLEIEYETQFTINTSLYCTPK
ncbi:MAG: hypothetical protein KF721_15285 [Ignavibacteriaceae bacterium]|nr:hypothetical protein [Ignavibacteriaceae bacterium]